MGVSRSRDDYRLGKPVIQDTPLSSWPDVILSRLPSLPRPRGSPELAGFEDTNARPPRDEECAFGLESNPEIERRLIFVHDESRSIAAFRSPLAVLVSREKSQHKCVEFTGTPEKWILDISRFEGRETRGYLKLCKQLGGKVTLPSSLSPVLATLHAPPRAREPVESINCNMQHALIREVR